MRIIGGTHKGKRISAPSKLPVRPTTDMAKESLFNILNNLVELRGISVLDLFAGTGNMSYEFGSRGSNNIVSVDQNFGCVKFISKTSRELDLPIKSIRSEVFRFLAKSPKSAFDLIFADPPYSLDDIPQLPDLIFNNGWLSEHGILIVEHGPEHTFSDHERLFQERKYGHVHFSFFE